jgi:hypothetical protein
MMKNLLTIVMLFMSSWLVGQGVVLPVELLSEQVSINYGQNQKYCFGSLGSGPIDYVDPFDNRWRITTVTNTEGKNYYAFKYRGGESYICYGEGFEDFNTRTFKEGELLDRGAVFEVHKKGNAYVLYCIGSKTYLHLKEFKRGGKVNGVAKLEDASTWDLIPVPSDPNTFLTSFKPADKSIAQHSFMICNEKEDKCISIDQANKKTEWVAIPDHSSKVLWQIIPMEGFKNIYLIRNSSTKEFLWTDYQGGFSYRNGATQEYAKFWYINVSKTNITLTPVPAVFGDNPKGTNIDESFKLSLIRRDS